MVLPTEGSPVSPISDQPRDLSSVSQKEQSPAEKLSAYLQSELKESEASIQSTIATGKKELSSIPKNNLMPLLTRASITFAGSLLAVGVMTGTLGLIGVAGGILGLAILFAILCKDARISPADALKHLAFGLAAGSFLSIGFVGLGSLQFSPFMGKFPEYAALISGIVTGAIGKAISMLPSEKRREAQEENQAKVLRDAIKEAEIQLADLIRQRTNLERHGRQAT